MADEEIACHFVVQVVAKYAPRNDTYNYAEAPE
jgi:hypothetical protein